MKKNKSRAITKQEPLKGRKDLHKTTLRSLSKILKPSKKMVFLHVFTFYRIFKLILLVKMIYKLKLRSCETKSKHFHHCLSLHMSFINVYTRINLVM